MAAARLVALAGALLAAAPARAPSARCKKAYARSFIVERGGARVELRLVRGRPAPPPGSLPGVAQAAFEGGFQACRALGEGWRVATGSYSKQFLVDLEAAAPPPLKAALAACPVTYTHVDTTCAPCAAGHTPCPCAERDISDWIFCERPR